jgi:hypothetical protein
MKCQSCSENVPDKFKSAIAKNECPLCGDVIMSEKLKESLALFKELMVDLEEFKEPFEEWLFANYSYRKGGGNNDIDENGHIVNGSGEMSIFAKNAGMKNKPLKRIVDQIKEGGSSGAADPSEFVGVDDEYGVITPDNIDEITGTLNRGEETELDGLFNEKPNPQLEMERLKRLRSRSQGGGFNRGG